MDADHLAVEAALDPSGLPDALSHRVCNQIHGASLSSRLRGVTDPNERRRICVEVAELVHARLRKKRPATRPHELAKSGGHVPHRKVSTW